MEKVSPHEMTLWILSPCYFDVASYRKLMEQICICLASSGLTTKFKSIRFILLDDSAGKDPAVDALLEDDAKGEIGTGSIGKGAQFRLIRPPFNMGHQGALVFGLRTLECEIQDQDLIVTLDGDGEDRPENLIDLVQGLIARRERLDLVAIARRTRRREALPFKVLYLGFKAFFRIAVGQVIRSGNFLAIRGKLLREIIFHPNFDQCYASTFVSLKLNVLDVPCPRGDRYAGVSKMGYWSLIAHGIRMLMPFSEQIATRGFVAGAVGLALAGVLCSTFLAIESSIVLTWCSLLFATTSQNKSRTLRGLNRSRT